MEGSQLEKILVIQTAFIGDVVLATALIEKLHLFYPNAKIDFLVRRGNEGLLQNHPYLHETLVWDKKNGKYKHLFLLLKKIRTTRYDAVVNVQRFAATGLLTAFSRAPIRIGFDKNPWSFAFTKKVKHVISTPERPLHEVDRNQELIAMITDSHAVKPKLYPSPEDFAKVASYKGKPYICVAPASVWYTKQFPKEKWIEAILQFPEENVVVILGGPSDVELCSDIENQIKDHISVHNVAGKLSLLQSAALQKDAIMNYVNDSAPMHFASSMNAPTAAIYCSTVPSFGFGPLSDQRFIIETEETLDCRPCGLHGFKICPKGHFKCALTIKPEQLTCVLS